ncbi:MAG: TonB-dependent receptor plug domain-containing protein, partial [Bdellovibrionota bacterium]
MIFTLVLALAAHAETLPLAYDRTAPVVISSDIDKSSQPLVTAPGNYLEKGSASIHERIPHSIKAAIGAEPNINIVGSPRSTAELPQIRGLGAERILILDEGVRQNYQSGHNGRLFSDFSLMERIEVVKGPWSSLYGSGAMGGVISLRRSTAEDMARKYGKDNGAELALDGGSNASAFGQRATAFGKAGSVTPLLSYHHLKSGNIKLGDGSTLPFSRLETDDVYASVGAKLSAS